MREKFATIDEYLAAVPEDQRAALEDLRQKIRSVVPEAVEGIAYRLCAFKLRGKWLVAFGAAAHHCAFYLMSATALDGFTNELRDFNTSKGTIRFQPDHRLPADLVRRLVEARMAENEE